jgi:hypothetical protein
MAWDRRLRLSSGETDIAEFRWLLGEDRRRRLSQCGLFSHLWVAPAAAVGKPRLIMKNKVDRDMRTGLGKS